MQTHTTLFRSRVGLHVDGVRSAPSTVTSTTLPTLYDSRWHHLVVSIDATSAVSIVLDGTAQTFAPSSLQGASFTPVQVGGSFPDSPPFTGYLAHLALYSYPLTSDQITRHKQAGLTWANETADDRVKRYLTYAGVDPADMLLDDSTLVLSPYPQQGRNVLDGVQAATDSEGGGSLYYVRYDGKHRRVGRVARQITTQAFAVSATDDLAGDTYQPSYGQDNLVNQVTASRAAGETDTASTQTVTDAASVDEFGPISDQLTSYARFDTDVLSVAQQRIASQSRPAWRLQQVSIDLYTAQQAGLGAEVAVMEVGTRFKVYDLDTSAAPRSEIDLIAEGWTDTFSDSTYRRVIDTSAADNPAPLIWGADPGVYRPYYSRWQTDGHTLQTAISATATTISIRTPAGSAQFTSEPGCYSLQILVGEEVITLTGPPTGSGVQTFPCLRGQAGTPAAAQAAGAAVALYPTSTWLL